LRVAAVNALATLADPRLYTLRPRLEAEACIHWGWYAHHAVQEEGVQPLTADARAAVVRVLRRAGRADPNAEVRRSASFLARCIVDLDRRQRVLRR
ncbi:MAG TPA: hypothetical protein VFQ39_00445, partial [Longimicrobium sp.]|nr:hypothetical protein [Longimicrobium sp.]